MNRVPRDKLLFIPADLMNGISNENAEIVTKYVQEMINEGLSKRHCSNSGLWAAMLAKRTNKPFKKMTRDNIIEFLNSFIIPEDQDPLWKSTGTYNIIRVCIRRFFRWLYNPNVSSSKRKTLSPPKVIENIPTRVRRKGREIYKHSDLWTQEDVALFLKYSRYLRDSTYVAMAHETSARPHELLRLKIKDIEDKIMPNNVSYTGFIASGKTGERELVLINSIPIVRKWIDAHPQSANPNAALFYSKKKNHMSIETLESIFKKYKEKHFPALLNTDIPEEDKQKIKELIKKPWNPYIFRHTDLTNKTRFLIEAELEQHAGWRPGSKMRVRYQHLVGNEYNETILRRAGKLPPKDEEKDMLKPKECPKCGEPNEPNARWCHKCKDILSLKGYLEALESVKKKDEERDNTIEALRKQMRDMIELSAKQNGMISDYKGMVKEGMSRERKLIEQCNDYKGMVKEVQSEYDGIREDYSDLKGLFDKSMSMTKTAFGRIDELQSVMSGGLLTKHLIKPGSRTAEELQRVVNIILQVVPDWRERGAAGILRLTSEENQKVMELMNQQKS